MAELLEDDNSSLLKPALPLIAREQFKTLRKPAIFLGEEVVVPSAVLKGYIGERKKELRKCSSYELHGKNSMRKTLISYSAINMMSNFPALSTLLTLISDR